MISEEDIFNKFHKYTYKDIEEVDLLVKDLFMQAVSEKVCRDILRTDGELVYLSSVLEYISYNSIPLKYEHNLENIIGNGVINYYGTDKACIIFTICYYKGRDVLYSREFNVHVKGKELQEIVYNTYPFIQTKNGKKIVDLT